MRVETKALIDKYIGDILILALFLPVRFLGLILKKKHSFETIKSVAFVKLMGGGSLFLALPSILYLKQKGVKVHALCGKGTKGFAELMNVFDSIVVIDDSSTLKLIISSIKAIWFLNRSAEATIDLELHSRFTTLLTTLSLVHTRFGLIDAQSLWRKRLYTHSLYVNPASSAYAAYDAISTLWGNTTIARRQIAEHFAPRLQKYAQVVDCDYISIGVGCSQFGKQREASLEFWTRLGLEILNTTVFPLVFLGGKEDSDFIESIICSIKFESDKAQIKTDNRIFSFSGKIPLEHSLAIIGNAKAYIGIDSALLHFSMMLGRPSIGLWGPTQPISRLKFRTSRDLHLYQHFSCSPCVHVVRSPPCGGRNQCMDFGDQIPSIINHLLTQPAEMENEEYQQTVWIYQPNGESQSYSFGVKA